jgi:hypothetical protein
VKAWPGIAALAVVPTAFAVAAATSGPAPARTAVHASCPSRSQITSLPRWRPGGVLRGDVDGDGRPDSVLVRWAKWADGRCAFYLVVSTARSTYTLPLGHWIGDLGKLQYNAPIRTWPWRIPAVEAIVDLGGRDNLIALGDNAGASNLFVRLVAFDRGRFRWLPVGREGELSPGGPMTYVTTESCTRGGPLRDLGVYDAWTRKDPNRWSFSSVTYRRRGWRFVAVAHHAVYGSYAAMWRVARRAGISPDPLAGCSVARNPNFDGAGGF